jgi:O-antigen ligase
MTLYLNDPEAPISTPNEAGTATLVVGVVLMIRHVMRPQWINPALGALMIAMLGLTQSRSGILAWGTFGLFTLRWVRPSRLLAGALTIAALLPLMPQSFWIRMVRSVAVEKGTFEAYSLFERIYGWRTAWGVVKEHPWTGIGYLGFRFVSHAYNEMRIVLITVENYYYEVLVSMGIVGLVVLAVIIVRLFQVGRAVARTAPRGTLAHHMARFHAPLLLGLLVANMTGDNFMGMVGLAQVAMWTAVLVRSGHDAAGHGVQPLPAAHV